MLINRAKRKQRGEKTMIKYASLLTIAVVVLYWSIGSAQQHPLMDKVANKVVQKYQQATCEQLLQQKNEPKSPQEQEFVQKVRSNPQIRTEFINRVAAPIANKMFECGLIP
jgi:hypothetical protein